MVALLNRGNPDFRQDETRPLPGTIQAYARVDSLAEASRLCREYIQEFDLGGGNWTGGLITEVRNHKKVVGHVSYNGIVWPGQPRDWTPETQPLYHPNEQNRNLAVLSRS